MQIDVTAATTAIGDGAVAVGLILMALIIAFGVFWSYAVVVRFLKQEGVLADPPPEGYYDGMLEEGDIDEWDPEQVSEEDWEDAIYEQLDDDERYEYWRIKGFNHDDARSRAESM